MSDKTAHKLTTVHGLNTPHRLPSTTTSNVVGELGDLYVQLYPTGRAFYQNENGIFRKFHSAINTSIGRLMRDADLIIEKNIPDNDNFNIDDCRLWEYRLGLSSNESLDLTTRRLMIKRKLGHPNNVKSRQTKSYMEFQLQAAGFDVYVHENTIPYQSPNDIIGLSSNEVQHADDIYHGDSLQHGGDSFDVIANSFEESEAYAIGGEANLWATFFIGGENLGDYANITTNRLREFKELVLKLKPAHLAAFTFINYT